MMVLDASAVVELVLQTPRASALTEEILLHSADLHAPHLVDVEVAQVLRRLCSRKEVSEDRALEALHDLSDLPLVRHSHEFLLDRAWELKDNLTIYDGVYVALAELLDLPLLTLDQGVAAAPGHSAVVRVLS